MSKDKKIDDSNLEEISGGREMDLPVGGQNRRPDSVEITNRDDERRRSELE